MHVKMIVTYCNGDITPKEAHIDALDISRESAKNVLDACIKDLRNNIAKIEKILPAHLKANPIDITLHGEAMLGFDFKHNDWNFDKILFNILQLGIPENKQPIIKI